MGETATWINKSRGENEIEESGTVFSIMHVSTPGASANKGGAKFAVAFRCLASRHQVQTIVDENHEIAFKEKLKQKATVDR